MHAEHAQLVRERRAFVKLISGRRPRRKFRGRLPKQQQPDDIRLSYYADMRRLILQPMHQLVKSRLLPELPGIVAGAARGDAAERQDAGASSVNKLMRTISHDFMGGNGIAQMEDIVRRHARATSERQKEQLGRQLKTAFGVEVPLSDTTLKPVIEHFTATNVALINTIPQRYFSQVEQVVLNGIGAGSRWEDIATDIEGRFDVSEGVAKVIARDQVGKFYANLNEARQNALGITHFYWTGADDERECELCLPYNGKRYAWTDPPAEGLPGEVHPQCRCSADPDVEDVVAGLDDDRSDRADQRWDARELQLDQHRAQLIGRLKSA